MSREWTYYDVTCHACGNVGELAMWDDDWNRWDAHWTGFKGVVYVTGPMAASTECLKCKAMKPLIKRRAIAEST